MPIRGGIEIQMHVKVDTVESCYALIKAQAFSKVLVQASNQHIVQAACRSYVLYRSVTLRTSCNINSVTLRGRTTASSCNITLANGLSRDSLPQAWALLSGHPVT